MDDDYGYFYKLDMSDEWANGGYNEQGERVICDCCGEDLYWDPEMRYWVCRNCGVYKNRVQWFSYIDANPPGSKCLSQCQENYPMCKNWCMLYEIPDDDPIL